MVRFKKVDPVKTGKNKIHKLRKYIQTVTKADVLNCDRLFICISAKNKLKKVNQNCRLPLIVLKYLP